MVAAQVVLTLLPSIGISKTIWNSWSYHSLQPLLCYQRAIVNLMLVFSLQVTMVVVVRVDSRWRYVVGWYLIVCVGIYNHRSLSCLRLSLLSGKAFRWSESDCVIVTSFSLVSLPLGYLHHPLLPLHCCLLTIAIESIVIIQSLLHCMSHQTISINIPYLPICFCMCQSLVQPLRHDHSHHLSHRDRDSYLNII